MLDTQTAIHARLFAPYWPLVLVCYPIFGSMNQKQNYLGTYIRQTPQNRLDVLSFITRVNISYLVLLFDYLCHLD